MTKQQAAPRCRGTIGWSVAVLLSLASAASAVPIYGGPTNGTTVQYQTLSFPLFFGQMAGDGVGVGYAFRYSGGYAGSRPLRWSANGVAEQLNSLAANPNAESRAIANAVNASGVAVGYADEHGPSGTAATTYSPRAVVWNVGTTTPTRLASLNVPASDRNLIDSRAVAINVGGTVIGSYQRYWNDNRGDVRAVRWDAGQTTATELLPLGYAADGSSIASVRAISDTGITVGSSTRFGAINTSQAVRWTAGSVTPTALDLLNPPYAGESEASAYAVNDAGTAVGSSKLFSNAGVDLGHRAVRWDAGTTAATILGTVDVGSGGVIRPMPLAINDAGTAVGYVGRSDTDGTTRAERAVRWDAGQIEATALPLFEVGVAGTITSRAYGVSDFGFAVGTIRVLSNTGVAAQRAIAWDPAGNAIDLLTLVEPGSGWSVLYEARSISDTNWVTGIGFYDPDGAGGVAGYSRFYTLQIPEPTTLGALAGVAVIALRRRRIS